MRSLIWCAAIVASLLWGGCAHAPKSSETGSLAGKVVDERGNAVAGARVWLEGISDEPLTRVDGSFQLLRLFPGTYNVSVKTPTLNCRFKEALRVNAGRETGVELVLTEPPITQPVPAKLPPETRTGAIWGTVVDEDVHGIRYASVIVINAQTGAVTDGAGRFLIRIPIGTYTVRARCVGFGQVDRERVRVSEGDTTQVDFKLRAVKVEVRY